MLFIVFVLLTVNISELMMRESTIRKLNMKIRKASK